MGQLVLVRHAQASFFGANYDELSELGCSQAQALGEHWARHGVRFDHVYVGPLRRHQQTLALVAAAFRAQGLAWPAARELPDLDEHDGLAVIRHALARAGGAAPAMPAGPPSEGDRESLQRAFFKQYGTIMRDWARGAVAVPDTESWAQFRARSLRALDAMCAEPGAAVAFTSGGLVSSAAGWLLGLDDERVIDLSAVLLNTGLTEVQFAAHRRRLVSFNAVPHLPDPARATAV